MARVVIRKIDDDVMARLKARAHRKGVSKRSFAPS
jgi:plasmid stability protein